MSFMQVCYSIPINDSEDHIWNTLSSFDGVERYFSIVTQSKVDGHGPGAKRTSSVNLGNHDFQLCETLQSLDDVSRSMTVKLEDGPIQMRGMKFTYNVKKLDHGKSDLLLYTYVENPDAASMAKSIFSLIGQGLKKFHET